MSNSLVKILKIQILWCKKQSLPPNVHFNLLKSCIKQEKETFYHKEVEAEEEKRINKPHMRSANNGSCGESSLF